MSNENTGDIQFAYFGSGGISTIVLDGLEKNGFVPSLIVAQPDKPKGRGLIMTPPEIKEWAYKRGILTIQPTSLEKIPDELSGTDWDVFVVVSYGKILPEVLIDLPIHGAVNVHPSLLPKLRGPSPIQSTILEDNRKTGVTIMLLDEEMDHGPVLAQASIEIEDNDWPLSARELTEILAYASADVLSDTLPKWLNGDIKPEAQDHNEATYTKKFTKDYARIDLDGDPRKNLLKIKAFTPSPGAWCIYKKDTGEEVRLKIKDAKIENGVLVLSRIVPEGKKEISFEEFVRE